MKEQDRDERLYKENARTFKMRKRRLKQVHKHMRKKRKSKRGYMSVVFNHE